MKRLKVLLLTILMIGLCITATCQTRNDSSVIANSDLRKGAILIEQGKANKAELQIQRENVKLLSKRVELKDSIIYEYGIKGRFYEGVIQSQKGQIELYDKEIEIYKAGLKAAEKALKKQKAKTWFVGILSAGAIGYLVFK